VQLNKETQQRIGTMSSRWGNHQCGLRL